MARFVSPLKYGWSPSGPGKKSGTTMMGDAQKNMRMDRQRILDVKDDDGATALMILGQGNIEGI